MKQNMVKTPVGLLAVGVLALSLFYNVGVMLGNTVADLDDSPLEQQRQQLEDEWMTIIYPRKIIIRTARL